MNGGKRLPAASEIVAKVLNERGDDISVDEIEDIYEQNKHRYPTENRHERRKRKRQSNAEIEKEATEFVRAQFDRVGWLLVGEPYRTDEWEQPFIAKQLEAAIRGDDEALAWLKLRFPPRQ